MRRGRSGLAWFESGPPSAPAVVYFHGTPKTKDDRAVFEAGERMDLRLLTCDRPGYGDSPLFAGASFADVATLVLGDLDDQGVDRFSVLGWSGGGPHALAVAAAAPKRVRAVGLLGSWAPMDPPDRGLPLGVRFAMRVAAALPRPAVRLMLLGRPRGMVDDVRRVACPWGFDVERLVSSVPVVAWHAAHDRQVPVAPWRAIKGVDLNVVDGDSHDVGPELWEVALRTLATDRAGS